MKLLCLILSLYVMVLSTKPCCDDDCLDKSAAKKEYAQKMPVNQEDCAGCSPFLTCGSCVGFVIAQPLILPMPSVAADHVAYGNVYRQPYIEKVALAIWLPPELS